MKTSPIYSTVNIAEIEQINAGWAWETVVSENSVKICWAIYFHLYSPNLKFQKDKF